MTGKGRLPVEAVHLCERSFDALGFVRPNGDPPESYTEFWSNYLPILVRREKRWLKSGNPRGEKLKRFIRKGIPTRLRPKIWCKNCQKVSLDIRHKVSEETLDEIRRDLSRTFPDNQTISSDEGKKSLGWILYAVAEQFPQIGYCQGFNYIAALLYLVIGDRETAARLLIYNVSMLQTYYDNQMSGIQTDLQILHHLLRNRGIIPNSLLRLMETDLEMMLSKWFVCWYLETLPMETVLRIWDCFFHEGDTVLFRIAIVLLESSVPALMKCQNASDIMMFIRNIGELPIAMDCHKLLEEAFAKDKNDITPKLIQNLRGTINGKVYKNALS